MLTSNQNAENLQGAGHGGVVSSGEGRESETIGKKEGVVEGEELDKSIQEALVAQQQLEKVAMSGLSKYC